MLRVWAQEGAGTRPSTHLEKRFWARGFASAKTSNEPLPCAFDCDEAFYCIYKRPPRLLLKRVHLINRTTNNYSVSDC